MDRASQPDPSSEWSKFAPLRPRTNSPFPLATTEISADSVLSPESVAPDADSIPLAPDNSIPSTLPEPTPDLNAPAGDEFFCQNRKCHERRARRELEPRHLCSARWRGMKIGKQETLVVDLVIRCPDCDFEHQYTLVPPQWVKYTDPAAPLT